MRKLLVCLALVTLTSCASTSFVIGGKKSDTPDYKQRQTHFLLYTLGENYVPDPCGDGHMVHARVQVTSTDFLFALFTLGLYTPRTVQVWCE